MTQKPLPPDQPNGWERLLGVLALLLAGGIVLGVALWAFGVLP